MSARALRLRDADRQVLRLVTEAAFANPFGTQRRRLDAEIGEVAEDDPRWSERMLTRVGKRLDALSQNGKLDPAAYAAEDRELIEHSALFETFHVFIEQLDQLIEKQRAQAGGPVKASFAKDLQSRLVVRGISSERARHALELFFQMRRAFYFISRGLVGRSSCMRQLREQLWRAVFTHDLRRYERQLWNRMEDFSTLLLGETGSGKGAAAAALGASGFIPFDADKGAFAYSFLDAFVPIHLLRFRRARDRDHRDHPARARRLAAVCRQRARARAMRQARVGHWRHRRAIRSRSSRGPSCRPRAIATARSFELLGGPPTRRLLPRTAPAHRQLHGSGPHHGARPPHRQKAYRTHRLIRRLVTAAHAASVSRAPRLDCREILAAERRAHDALP